MGKFYQILTVICPPHNNNNVLLFYILILSLFFRENKTFIHVNCKIQKEIKISSAVFMIITLRIKQMLTAKVRCCLNKKKRNKQTPQYFLTLNTLGKIFSRQHIEIFFLFFPENRI